MAVRRSPQRRWHWGRFSRGEEAAVDIWTKNREGQSKGKDPMGSTRPVPGRAYYGRSQGSPEKRLGGRRDRGSGTLSPIQRALHRARLGNDGLCAFAVPFS